MDPNDNQTPDSEIRDFDWDEILENQRKRNRKRHQENAERQERKDAHETACNALSPAALADRLYETLDIPDNAGFADYYEYIGKQLGVLHTVFYTKLHEAGLGFEHHLLETPTQTALHAQRLCRQAFDSIKNLDHKELGKGREEQ